MCCRGALTIETAGQTVTLNTGEAVVRRGHRPPLHQRRGSTARFCPGGVRAECPRRCPYRDPDDQLCSTGSWPAHVDDAVFALRPDHRALLIVAEGIPPRPAAPTAKTLLQRAESVAHQALRTTPVEELAHVAAWREVTGPSAPKPQRTRNSVEALLRRAETGLPRVNRLTDVYNAVSVLHQIPLGGEDMHRYAGSPRLIRAGGNEPFDTVAGGRQSSSTPSPARVVVRRRRRHLPPLELAPGPAHQLRDDTTAALFILDALDPITDDAVTAAADELTEHLQRMSTDVRTGRRMIANPAAAQGD